MKVRDVLRKGIQELNKEGIEDATLKARMLMQYELGFTDAQIVLYLDKEMPKEKEDAFLQNLQKLIRGMPIQYITNMQSFYGLDFYVDSNVLIPQPDTEILVEEIIEMIQKSFVEGVSIDTQGEKCCEYIKARRSMF